MRATAAAGLLAEALDRLSACKQRLLKIQRAAARYRPDDPAPYGAAAARLERQFAVAWQTFDDVERRRRQVVPPASAPAPAASRFSRLGSRLAQPAGRWRTGRRARAWLDAIQALEAELDQARDILQELDRKPLDTAARCRAARAIGDRLGPLAEELRDAGLCGATLEATVTAAAQLLAGLDPLPRCLFQETEALVLQEATKEATIQAWQGLDQIEAPLGHQVGQLEEWARGAQAIAAELANLRSVLAAARRDLDRAPRPLDVDELVAEVGPLRAEAGRLELAARSLQVEQLFALLASIRQVGKKAQDLARRAAALPRQLERLDGLFALADELLASIRRRMDELATLPEYPIDWEGQRGEAARHAATRSAVDGPGQDRTPASLARDVETLEKLCASLGALSEQIDLVGRQRGELLLLARRPELAAGPTWLAKAQKLHGVAADYAAENWPPAVAIPRLDGDARALELRRRAVMLPSVYHRLPAANLEQRLAEASALLRDVNLFQDRLDVATGEIVTLQRREQTAFQELRPAHQALEALVVALPNARPRPPRRIAAYGGRVRQIDEGCKALLAGFERRRHGTVEKKAGELHKWRSPSQNTLHGLVLALAEEQRRARAGLQSEIEQLRQLAPLDLEGAMIDATRLLRLPAPGAELSSGPGRNARSLSVAALASSANRILAGRPQPLAARQKLRTEIVEPLDRARGAWEKARDTVAAEYAAVVRLKKEVESTWPHLACDVERARSLLAQAEGYERHLAKQGRSVPLVRDIWSRMVEHYDMALAEIKKTARNAEEHRQELKELAEKLERWRRQLAAYQQAHADDQAIAEAIGARVQTIDETIASLSRQWAKHPPSFGEGRGALNSLWTRVHADVGLAGSNRTIRTREVEAASR